MIKGWCPGALRPMQSGDGLIVRLRISGGIVETRLAAAIAHWSRRWGNGQIDLTGRANLQLRGLSTQRLPDLHDALSEWNLLAGDAAAEAVRNVISSPLAGLDPDAALDVRPIVRALEQRLASDTALHELPAKFGFAIDDGGRFGLDNVAADIRFVACRLAGRTAFEIRLAGAPRDRFGPCSPASLADVAAALGRVFLGRRKSDAPHIRRMRDLVGLCGAETIARAAGLARSPSAAVADTPIWLSGCAIPRRCRGPWCWPAIRQDRGGGFCRACIGNKRKWRPGASADALASDPHAGSVQAGRARSVGRIADGKFYSLSR